MWLLSVLLFLTFPLFCFAIISNPFESFSGDEKRRFLRPDKTNGQLLRKSPVLPSTLIATTSGPNVFNGQKFSKSTFKSKSQEIVPFIPLLPSQLVRLPSGQQTTHIETAFSLEASVPIIANENEPVEESIERETTAKTTKTTTTERSTTTGLPEELDAQEENEIDKELGGVSMSSLFSIYFDARGLCEAIRLIFRYANESFVDERISKKQWLRIRGKTTFGKIPILVSFEILSFLKVFFYRKLMANNLVNATLSNFDLAISRYLARKFGLIGQDEWDQMTKVDEVAEFHRNVVTDISPYIYVLGEYREGNKDQLRKNVFLPAGKSVTWVDFAISEFFTTIEEYEPFILKKYPTLVKFTEKVHQLPQIRRYIRTRNKTPLNAS
ncbi:hypothetical protein M3Y97_00527900 [Aphelenchoides bicaudatus]|nr:hypothetical protein M3Y97_00527900 [Aphelenchoides bicaudatus]